MNTTKRPVLYEVINSGLGAFLDISANFDRGLSAFQLCNESNVAFALVLLYCALCDWL